VDFELTEHQIEIRDLGRRVFTDRVTGDRLKEVEAGREGFDRSLWNELGDAGLLGVAVPEADGGGGLGFLELCLVLEEGAAAAAPVPLFPSLVLGALPIAGFGTEEQRARLLPGVAHGGTILTAALSEGPALRAQPHGDGWRIGGTVELVPYADVASAILAPAATEEGGTGLFLLDPAGLDLEPQEVTTGEPTFRVHVNASVGQEKVLVEPSSGNDILAWTLQRALAALSVMQVGTVDRALHLTAEYTSGRDQFGRPLASFQAVQQRIADAYIDTLAMRWTAWRAAWRLAESLPGDEEVAVAKFWASEAGSRVVTAAQHLHGGMGVDVDYPLHRYTKQAKRTELMFGAATAQLARLGDLIAR
jgi:alkylation response protein AidB-like acyl-CoA dehydrogenase